MIGELLSDLGSGFWLVGVRDQTLRVYVDPVEFASPWWEPVVGDRVLVATGNPGWVVVGMYGKGAPSAPR